MARRTILASLWAIPFSRLRAADGKTKRRLELIEAPISLGLRPPAAGLEPGTWRAPAALEQAGLSRLLQPERHKRLARPSYSADPAPGTRVRNGNSLRAFSLDLAIEVEQSLARGAFPVVIGGDCSILLGCLLGLRRQGGRGLVHVDGHSDFFHPGNYLPGAVLGAAAGMDLALATGRGEALLTRWPGLPGSLVEDADVVQIGEQMPAAYPGLEQTAFERIPVRELHAAGVPQAANRALGRLRERAIERAWLHLDLDVLDAKELSAVDSPGSPGLTYAELTELLRALLRSGRIAGLNVSIYDPDRDPDGSQAHRIVACLAKIFAPDT